MSDYATWRRLIDRYASGDELIACQVGITEEPLGFVVNYCVAINVFVPSVALVAEHSESDLSPVPLRKSQQFSKYRMVDLSLI